MLFTHLLKRLPHLDAIAYPILKETHPRAIAAQVILRANDRGRLRGLFETSQTTIGIIKTTTVLTVLKSITSLSAISRLQHTHSTRLQTLRGGYENLYGVSINDLGRPDFLLERSTICFQRFFGLVATTFDHDWPQRGRRIGSSLEFAKMFAAFIQLLYQFMKDGFDWDQVRRELENIKNNIMRLRGLHDYGGVLFDPSHRDIPDSSPSISIDFKFLNANRTTPTSIQTIQSQ